MQFTGQSWKNKESMWKNCKTKISYTNIFILRKLDPQINTCMPCIVPRALILFTTPKDERMSKCNLSAYCCKSPQRKAKYTLFLVEMVELDT